MKAVKFAVAVVLLFAAAWGAWQWFICRFYVPPDHMAVLIAKIGKDLPAGQILADDTQQGVRARVLGEGRHFRNPFLYEHKIQPVVVIPPGKVGIVTSKVGKDLPQGEFLADEGEKGVWRRVLGPGKYRMNPVGYQIDVIDAISIPIGYVGVVTSLSGRPAPEGQFAGPDEKGIRPDIIQPGLYYVNTRQFKIDVLEIGLNQVSLLGRGGGEVLTKNIALQMEQGGQQGGVQELQRQTLMNQMQQRADYIEKSANVALQSNSWLDRLSSRRGGAQPRAPAKARPQAQQQEPQAVQAAGQSPTFVLNQFVEFPSRDGFEISLDMTVEFELTPERIAGVFRSYGDLPAVVEKALMPQILSISRLKGSAYRATDFIVGEGREKFQVDLTQELKRTLEERKIDVHNALIRHVNVPDEILAPIQLSSIAIEQDLTNKEMQNTAKKQAQLNTEMSLIEQAGQQVQQETTKITAEIAAQTEREVAQIAAEGAKTVAEIESETARVLADMTRMLGQAKARSVVLVEGERARGFEMKVQAFGDPVAFSLWEFAKTLSPDLKVNVLHAGEGTLWTDLQKAGLGDLGGAAVIQRPPPSSPAK